MRNGLCVGRRDAGDSVLRLESNLLRLDGGGLHKANSDFPQQTLELSSQSTS